jgi:hypothetical protein
MAVLFGDTNMFVSRYSLRRLYSHRFAHGLCRKSRPTARG